MTKYGGWIGVDLDGTLARDNGSGGLGPIGEPVPAMLRRVQDWIADGRTVKIVTARVAYDPGGAARLAIQAWCEQHIGMGLEVTCGKDLAMTELWDDRCVQVVPNTGRPIGVSGAFRWLFWINAWLHAAGEGCYRATNGIERAALCLSHHARFALANGLCRLRR